MATTRHIDDFAAYLAANITGLTLYHPTTATSGNLRIDTYDPSMAGTQVVVYQGDASTGYPLLGIQSGMIDVEVFGAEPTAYQKANEIFVHFQRGKGFSGTNYNFNSVNVISGGIVARGQIKPGIFNYGVQLSASWNER